MHAAHAANGRCDKQTFVLLAILAFSIIQSINELATNELYDDESIRQKTRRKEEIKTKIKINVVK